MTKKKRPASDLLTELQRWYKAFQSTNHDGLKRDIAPILVAMIPQIKASGSIRGSARKAECARLLVAKIRYDLSRYDIIWRLDDLKFERLLDKAKTQ